MVQYKLYYFNGRGRGEIVRLVFAAAGEQYEDVRFEREQWPTYKPKSPTGQSPFIEVIDGDKTFALAQSVSIARFLARRFNLAGQGDQEQAEVDMFADQTTDLINELAYAHYREKDEAKKKELQHKLETETVPNTFTVFEKRLSSTGSGFIAKSGLTYTDLYIYAVLEWFGEKKDSSLAHFPHLKKLEETVRTHPRIAEWLQKRPKTDM